MHAPTSPPVPLYRHKHHLTSSRAQIRIGAIPRIFKPILDEVCTEQKLCQYIDSIISIAETQQTSYMFPKRGAWAIVNQDGKQISAAELDLIGNYGPLFVTQAPAKVPSPPDHMSPLLENVVLSCRGWGALPTTEIRLPDNTIPYSIPETVLAVIVHFFHRRTSHTKRVVRESSVRAFLVPVNVAVGELIKRLDLDCDDDGKALREIYPIYVEKEKLFGWEHGKKYGESDLLSPIQAGWTVGQHLELICSLKGGQTQLFKP